MKKREGLNSKVASAPFPRSSNKKPLSTVASANLSGTRDPPEIDAEVEVDIYYSQYLQAKMIEKIQRGNMRGVENVLKAQLAPVMDEKTELQNPKVSQIKSHIKEVKHIGSEYVKLLDLKHQLEML